MRPSTSKLRPDQAISHIAADQYGLITRADALKAGLTVQGVERRLTSGDLVRMYAGVYRDPAVPRSLEQSLLAVCLRAPGRTWVGHRSAAAFWALDGFAPGPIEVVCSIRLRADPPVVVHEVSTMPESHVAVVRNIPVTTVHRTLVDLGSVASPDLVELALECALRRRIATIDRLWGIIEALGTKGRRGPAVLAKLLTAHDARPTESALETRCAQLFRRFGLPEPTRQHWVRDETGFVARVDFFYESAGLVVEIDGRSHHMRRQQWQQDLRRQNSLIAGGAKVLRITHEQMRVDPEGFVRDVEAVLGRR
jgi:very-short-patch-repair endonuclease